MNAKLLLLSFLVVTVDAFGIIKLFSYAHNRPDFIELQYLTFKKFLIDEHELVIFNDAPDQNMSNIIESVCKNLKIQCVRIPQEIHSKPYLPRPSYGPFAEYQQGSVRNCNVVQYSLNVMGFDHDDIVGLIDSDIFLVKKFSIREYMAGYDIAAWKRMCYELFGSCSGTHRNNHFGYLWIGLVFLDMRTMPNKRTINFNCGIVEGVMVDSGGFTRNYLKNNPKARVKFFDKVYPTSIMCADCLRSRKVCTHNRGVLEQRGFAESSIYFLQTSPFFGYAADPELGPDWFLEMFIDDTFFHYRGGTSPRPRQVKDQTYNNFFNNVLRIRD